MFLLVACTSVLLRARFPTYTDVYVKWFCVHDISSTKNYNLWSPTQFFALYSWLIIFTSVYIFIAAKKQVKCFYQRWNFVMAFCGVYTSYFCHKKIESRYFVIQRSLLKDCKCTCTCLSKLFCTSDSR